MFKIAFAEIRNAKWILAMIAVPWAIVWIALNIFFRHLDVDNSTAGTGLMGIVLLSFIPLLMLQLQNSQGTKNNRLAVVASLPVGGTQHAIARYLPAFGAQLVIATWVVISAAVDSFGVMPPVATLSAIVTSSFGSMALMAIGFLIGDFFPKKAPMVGTWLWLELVVSSRGKSTDWIMDHVFQPVTAGFIFVSTVSLVFLEIAVFSRRATLV